MMYRTFLSLSGSEKKTDFDIFRYCSNSLWQNKIEPFYFSMLADVNKTSGTLPKEVWQTVANHVAAFGLMT